MSPRTTRSARLLLAVVVAGLVTAALGTAAPAQVEVPDPADLLAEVTGDGVSYAGVASVDASWHLGASGGQFASTAAPVSAEFVDPHAHAVRKQPTDEIGSRILTRALVVQGADGRRIGVVANDLYLPNDLLNRRVGQLVQEHDAAVAAGL